MLVEFSDFFLIPRLFYKLLGFLPWIDGESLHPIETLCLSLGILSINTTIALELLYLVEAFNSTSLLDATSVVACIGFSSLAEFKVYVVWAERHKFISLVRGLKRLFPVDHRGQTRFKVADFLKRANKVGYVHLSVLFFGMTIFTCVPLCPSFYEHFFQGL